METVVGDAIRAVGLWPIWLRLGLQDVRRRFRRSALGPGWIPVHLAVMILAVGVVYGRLFGQELGGFLPFLTVGLVAWGYLTAAIVEGGNAFIVSEGYIKQIGLPVEVYVLRSFVSASSTMLISSVAYVVVALVYGVRFRSGTLWVVPGVCMLAGVCLLLMSIFAHLNTRFRDVAHIAALGMQILFYVTPVLWPAELLRTRGLAWVVDLNPLHHLLEVVRRPLLRGEPAELVDYAAVALLIGLLTGSAALVARRYHRRIVYFL